MEPLTLAQMLTDFFEFYAKFDFSREAVCLVTGRVQAKRSYDRADMEVTNPLEIRLNATQNVSRETVSKFQKLCETALRKLFLLNELPEGAELKFPKLTYVLSTGDPDVSLDKIYGMQSFQSPPGRDVRHQKGKYGKRRKQMQEEKKYLKMPDVRSLFVDSKTS